MEWKQEGKTVLEDVSGASTSTPCSRFTLKEGEKLKKKKTEKKEKGTMKVVFVFLSQPKQFFSLLFLSFFSCLQLFFLCLVFIFLNSFSYV